VDEIEEAVEAKFTKSQSNSGTQSQALTLLTSDRRFQVVDRATKVRIVGLLPVGAYGHQTFDAVMTPEPAEPITLDNVDSQMSRLRLVEMKSTRKPIRNAKLNGFFFGATEREYTMAHALGDRYLFAFTVLNSDNDYGRPFVVLLTLEQVEQRTSAKRLQYQVNVRRTTAEGPYEDLVVSPVPGEEGV
jgi:hypothetical protein